MASVARAALRPAARRLAARQLRPVSSTTTRWSGSAGELGVGELQGAKFKIEPLRRVGEDDATKRARLVYQSRKRGTLESDLLLSTFAAKHLATLPPALLDQYDLLLDENDWDIYYWATQKEELSSTNPANEAAPPPSPASEGSDPQDLEVDRDRPSGEWAQTVGNFKPAYRPVPARWRDSDILAMIRDHVRLRSVDGREGKGMGFMPPLGEQ